MGSVLLLFLHLLLFHLLLNLLHTDRVLLVHFHHALQNGWLEMEINAFKVAPKEVPISRSLFLAPINLFVQLGQKRITPQKR